jgi:hypothetical protein
LSKWSTVDLCEIYVGLEIREKGAHTYVGQYGDNIHIVHGALHAEKVVKSYEAAKCVTAIKL